MACVFFFAGKEVISLNKKFLKHYMETNPEGTAQTYIFLVDNQDIALNIVMSGYQALYQEIAKEHARMHARRAIVTRIEESDFGCEGRPDGVIAMDHVYLRYEQESEEFCLMAEDDQLYADHIDENSTVLVTADGKILPL